MAEGLARKMLGDRGTVQSAGAMPCFVHPLAAEVMREIGIDISSQKSKSVQTIDPKSVDVIVQLCAEEVCPAFLSNAKKYEWLMPDPSSGARNMEEALEKFRQVRDAIQKRIEELLK
jgi:arsenate reductase (thioredoxin)